MTGSMQSMMSGRKTTASLQVSLSTTSVIGRSTLATITTPSISATITGGVAPYSSAWSIITTDGIVATSPATPSTAFRKTAADVDISYIATASLTVTDSLGAVIVSSPVDIDIYRRPVIGSRY